MPLEKSWPLLAQKSNVELIFFSVNGANRMARELNKNVEYEICLVAPSLRGEPDGLTEVWVKLEDSNTGNVYYLPKAEFMNRKFEMQEIYQDYLDGNPEWDNSTEGTVKSTRSDPLTRSKDG